MEFVGDGGLGDGLKGVLEGVSRSTGLTAR